MMGEEK